MTSIIITPKSKSELELLSNLLKRLKIDASYLSDDEKEDIGLKILMKEANRLKTVPKAKIIKKLRSR